MGCPGPLRGSWVCWASPGMIRGPPHRPGQPGSNISRDRKKNCVMAMSWCCHGLEARDRHGIDRGASELVRTFNRSKKFAVIAKLGHFEVSYPKNFGDRK